MRVLLVEDDTPYAELVQDVLVHDDDISVVRVTTWTAAEQQLLEGGFDTLLLDLRLPDSDETATLQHIRGSRPEVTVIILSGQLTSVEQQVSVLRAGAQEALSKDDVDVQQLPDIMRRAAARQELLSGVELARREEQETRKRIERDLAWFDDLRKANSVSEASLGIQPLSEAAPEIYQRLASAYEELVLQALRRAVYRDQPHLGPKVRAFAQELAALRLGPREITELHAQALRSRLSTDPAEINEHISGEGRLLLVEVMGYVLTAYRNQAMSRSQGAAQKYTR